MERKKVTTRIGAEKSAEKISKKMRLSEVFNWGGRRKARDLRKVNRVRTLEGCAAAHQGGEGEVGGKNHQGKGRRGGCLRRKVRLGRKVQSPLAGRVSLLWPPFLPIAQRRRGQTSENGR